jgi:pheromone a factor receptor
VIRKELIASDNSGHALWFCARFFSGFDKNGLEATHPFSSSPSTMSDASYPFFSIFAILGFVLVLIPLPWHLEAWNSGTCYYMMWTALACINQFVNSIIWAGNARNSAPAWCEICAFYLYVLGCLSCMIAIRIVFGSSVGIPAASLCIMRRLYSIAKVQAVILTPATVSDAFCSSAISNETLKKRRAIIIDTLICVLFPLVFIALREYCGSFSHVHCDDGTCRVHITRPSLRHLRGHRMQPICIQFNCGLHHDSNVAHYFGFDIRRLQRSVLPRWHLTFIHVFTSVLSIRAFFQRRAQLAEFLSSSKLLTMGRYLRLMALACTEILCTTPLAIFMTYLNTLQGVVPYTSWADVHYDYSRVGQYLAIDWQSDRKTAVALELGRWLPTVCAFVFFMFFGFAEEARKNYRATYRTLRKFLGSTTNIATPERRSVRCVLIPLSYQLRL